CDPNSARSADSRTSRQTDFEKGGGRSAAALDSLPPQAGISDAVERVAGRIATGNNSRDAAGAAQLESRILSARSDRETVPRTSREASRQLRSYLEATQS